MWLWDFSDDPKTLPFEFADILNSFCIIITKLHWLGLWTLWYVHSYPVVAYANFQGRDFLGGPKKSLPPPGFSGRAEKMSPLDFELFQIQVIMGWEIEDNWLEIFLKGEHSYRFPSKGGGTSLSFLEGGGGN